MSLSLYPHCQLPMCWFNQDIRIYATLCSLHRCTFHDIFPLNRPDCLICGTSMGHPRHPNSAFEGSIPLAVRWWSLTTDNLLQWRHCRLEIWVRRNIPYLLSTLFQVGSMIVIQPKICISACTNTRWGRKTTTNVKRDGYDVFTVLEFYQKSMEFPCSGHCVAGNPFFDSAFFISESPGSCLWVWLKMGYASTLPFLYEGSGWTSESLLSDNPLWMCQLMSIGFGFPGVPNLFSGCRACSGTGRVLGNKVLSQGRALGCFGILSTWQQHKDNNDDRMPTWQAAGSNDPRKDEPKASGFWCLSFLAAQHAEVAGFCVRARKVHGPRVKAHAVFASPRDTRFDVELLVAWRAERRDFCSFAGQGRWTHISKSF